ncbi:MAG TPA: molybdenum cofactor guanylyltransferase [Dissulfurispiraceae bacterium]
MRDIAGVILAGGENTRFPSLKGFIRIGEASILERNLALLREQFREVFISTNMPEKYFHFGAPLIGDVLPSKGPMSGIYSSLLNAEGEGIFVAACDMPFLNPGLISLVCRKHLGLTVQADATIPVFRGEAQPLAGIYCKSIVPLLEEGILKGKTSLRRFLGEIRTNFIDEEEVRALDPEGMSFANINTMEDYERIIATGKESKR